MAVHPDPSDDTPDEQVPRPDPPAGLDDTQTNSPLPMSGDPAVARFHTPTSPVIARYRILNLIGAGGMGAVWKAEQREPVQRIVAVKVIKAGVDTAEVIARFESERQALARMDHPHIAKVLDAGSDERGHPYFVMEYVPGVALTSFADDNKLSVRDRLELFIHVCDAIGHAHSKAIIHRDIKSPNVLAFIADGKPMVKVIDFGIAKAVTGDRLTDRTFFTQTGQAVGTYETMSPEQADASPDIDTRTDVYALGVLLYELLTGSTPFNQQMLGSGTDAEIRRIIREVDAPRPSTRLSGLGAKGSTIAAARRVQLAALARELRSELEWIPLKALRKERDRRYASPMQMAEDVRNYLEGKPLIAAPDSRRYRIGKFIRRNRGAVVATMVLFIAVIISAIGFALGKNKANTALAKEQRALNTASEQREELQRQNAEIHARAALFAEQRGNWSVAYDEYRAAEDANYPEILALKVGQLRALDRSARVAEAKALIATVNGMLPAVASSPSFQLNEGFFLWTSDAKASDRLIRQALLHADQLSRGDRTFAEALIADNISVSAAKVREALSYDPLNRSALEAQCLFDLFLGDAPLSERDAGVMRALFPDDDSAAMIAALAAAFQGRRRSAIEYLDRDEKLPAELKSLLVENVDMICQFRTVDDWQKSLQPSISKLLKGEKAYADAQNGSAPFLVPNAFGRLVTTVGADLNPFKMLIDKDAVFQIMIDAFPNGTGEYFAGLLAVSHQQYLEAVKHFEAVQTMPNLIDAHRAAAADLAFLRWYDSYLKNGPEPERTRLAAKDLDQLIALGGIIVVPGDSELLNMNVAKRANLQVQCKKLAEMLLVRSPDNAQAKYYLAWADSQLGQNDLAIALYKQALAGTGLPQDLVDEAHVQLKRLAAFPSSMPTSVPSTQAR